MEIDAVVNWTPALAATFESMHGYSIGKYAILLNDNNQNYLGLPSLNWFYLNTPDRGQPFIDDYRSTLTSLAATYLKAFETWSHGYMDMQYSAQVGVSLVHKTLQLSNICSTTNLSIWNSLYQ